MTHQPIDRAGFSWVADSPIPIIPALDLKGGQVVRGTGGDRDTYEPWRSELCPTADPREFADRVQTTVGHDALYVADIDALQGGAVDWPLIGMLARSRRLICDVGLCNEESAERLAQSLSAGGRLGSAVLASESMPSLAAMARVVARVSPDQLVFSFDWEGDDLRCAGRWVDRTNWLDVAAQLAEMGMRRFLMLDLRAVGSGQGATLQQECRLLRQCVADAEIVAGGGVNGVSDVTCLCEAGCDAVLAATVLHLAGTPECRDELKKG